MIPALHLPPRLHELSPGFVVRRVLPAAARRAVGPFVFFDHFGPVTLPAGADTDVNPHPHIGLATVTYLFAGRMLHRDSLGSVQPIAPGAVNWMTAGRGIVHSERALPEDRAQPRDLHGLQLWVALPPQAEDCAPSFQHVPAADVPALDDGPAHLRLLAGTAFGARSPVRTAWPTLYLDVALPAGAAWTLPPLFPDLAIYSPEAPLQLDGHLLPPGEMAVLAAGAPTTVAAIGAARFVVIGGDALPALPRLWWNFVASTPARIAAAAARWEADGFDPVPGETARIRMPPLPAAGG